MHKAFFLYFAHSIEHLLYICIKLKNGTII